MYASGETSIVRFDRPPCAVCAELDPLFEIMRTHFPGRVWRVDCAAAPDLCAPVDGDLRGPEIRAWTGEAFAAYGGERSAEALVGVAARPRAPPKTENFAAADFDPRGDDDAAATRAGAGAAAGLAGAPAAHAGFVAKLATNATFAAKFPFVAIVRARAATPGDARAARPRRSAGRGSYGWVPDNFARIDAIIAAAARHLGGDPARVLLTGQSYGGRGVWAYAAARPSTFAAVAPICASSGPTAPLVAGLCCGDAACCPHVWAFHGRTTSAPTSRTRTRGSRRSVRTRGARRPRRSATRATTRRRPSTGRGRGHGADGLAYDDDDFWAWLAARECPACAADGPFAGVG
ncbi:hypothetical protein JL721_5765 [Aureococcus anophagefferens]|nr:hypothetical protein JL721_5765 [Aureococcus anophagefferens]